jgi:hypothetical protein
MSRKIPILVSGEYRLIPEEWWLALDGPLPPADFANNGCTFSFDELKGFILWAACVIHDWHYSPECEEITSRMIADWKFQSNTYKLLRLQGVGAIKARVWAFARWMVVARVGGAFFKRPASRAT